MKKLYCIICKKYKKLKNLKYHASYRKHWFLLLFAASVKMKIKKKKIKEESIEILKILGLIRNI